MITATQKHPALLLIIFIGIFCAALLISQFIEIIILYPFLGNQVLNLGNVISHPSQYDAKYKNVILFLQGFTTFFSMVLTPLLFAHFYYVNRLMIFDRVPKLFLFMLCASLVFVAMPFNGWVADWNLTLVLPEYFSNWEVWAKAKELEMKVLTEYITNFDNETQFFFGLLVIAVLPAIGEELIFRGVIQNLFNDWFKNVHVAIWLAAIIFSAIHLQFYGFFPRVLLGALFGYLYVWSGNILIPMIGHFVNNGFTLLLIHLKNKNLITIDLETTKNIPAWVIIISASAVVILLYAFRKRSEHKMAND